MGGRNWPCCDFSQFFIFINTYTKKTYLIFRKWAGEKYFDMQQIFHHCLKTVWSPKPEKTSVLIHEQFTSKQKKEGEERREVTLLHNPVKSLLSEWCYCDFVAPIQHQNHSRDLQTKSFHDFWRIFGPKPCLCCLNDHYQMGLIWKTNCL